MFEPQRLVDLQENSSFGGDPKSWLLSDHEQNSSSPSHHQRTHSSLSNSTTITGTSRNVVDPNLYNDLVEFFPLVQSYLDRDRKKNSSFTRRGSMVYTKTPSKEPLSKKITELKGRNAQSIPTKKRRDPGDKDGGGDSFLISSTKTMATEKDKEELKALREQVEDLQRKLLEKDDVLKSAEISKNQISDVHAKLDDLKHLVAKKDSLIQSTQSQLSDAKIKLADKQAVLEKTQWEAMTSNRKVEKLQEDLDSIQGEKSALMLVFESLTKNESSIYAEDYDVSPYQMDHLPQIDDLNEMELQRMEEARKAYIAAVAVAKEKQDEESIAAAASARFHLQSFVFRTESISMKESPSVGIFRAATELAS